MSKPVAETNVETNVAIRLSQTAACDPSGVAVVEQLRRGKSGHRYRQVSFRALDEDSSTIAAHLRRRGVVPGTRLVLLVPPSIDFFSMAFALFKVGAVTILIDPGMGREHLVNCLVAAAPDGFVGVPMVHAMRMLVRQRFPRARHNVTVGRRWFWGGATLRQLRRGKLPRLSSTTAGDDPAAIIFTTGSTGPPKGVLYRHANFNQQVNEIRDYYGIRPGEVDVACFPLFALFNAAMGVTTVIPRMDFTRPAEVEPRHIVAAIEDWRATQAFGSPALWNTVAQFCEQHQQTFPTVKRILSAGAPVPAHVLHRMKKALPEDGEIYTPYGATEALPIASISASEVLGETAAHSAEGGGTCVGSRFPGVQWKVIRITDEPLKRMGDADELPRGEIGELVVSGPAVTREYATRLAANPLHKIRDGERLWHRMGDVGYLDGQDRFWFCGRKSHRIHVADTTMYTIPCEAIVNQHERVYRSALVDAGQAGQPVPVMVVELWPDRRPRSDTERQQILDELWELVKSRSLTSQVRRILLHPSLPVDIRHNSKIFRERLAEWATEHIS